MYVSAYVRMCVHALFLTYISVLFGCMVLLLYELTFVWVWVCAWGYVGACVGVGVYV